MATNDDSADEGKAGEGVGGYRWRGEIASDEPDMHPTDLFNSSHPIVYSNCELRSLAMRSHDGVLVS